MVLPRLAFRFRPRVLCPTFPSGVATGALLCSLFAGSCARTEPFDTGSPSASWSEGDGGSDGEFDAGEPSDAGWRADAGLPDGGLISEIRFEDVHLTAGNPRKVNPNTRESTDPDNVVRLSVASLRDTGSLSLLWKTDLGSLQPVHGEEARFQSHTEGDAHVTCTATFLRTGERQQREITIRVKKAFRSPPILRGDFVAWTLWSDTTQATVQAVHLSTRELLTLGPGTMADFDGRTVAARPRRFGDKSIVLYRVDDRSSRTMSPPSLSAMWDFRHVAISGQRLFWSTCGPTYETDTLYTMSLADGREELVSSSELIRGKATWTEQMLFSVGAPSSTAFHTLRFDAALPSTEAMPQLDAFGVVRSWRDPWLVAQGIGRYTVLNRNTLRGLDVRSRFDSVVGVEVSDTHYGGLAREAFGNRGEIFLAALDGSYEKRIELETNGLLNPSVDGRRIAWVYQHAVFLYEAP